MKSRYLLLLMVLIFNSYFLIGQDLNLSVTILNKPAPGYVMFSPNTTSSLGLMDNSGFIVHTRELAQTRGGLQFFGCDETGSAVFCNKNIFDGTAAFYLVDKNYNVLDTFTASPEYKLDFHDFVRLNNGHYFILAIDTRTVDMRSIVPGGKENARVDGFVIQEFDQSHTLVWSWNTWDHFRITDATDGVDLTDGYIYPWHCNAISIEPDGNILLSSRHIDEITKINHTTGEIIWRMGGSKCKNNQFTFINDTLSGFFGFSHQHNVQRLPNGNILLFDNGNLKNNKESRAVEYFVNEANKTVTKVWEYFHYSNIISTSMGGVQRLPNGNTIICWGTIESNPTGSIAITEIDPSGNIVFEVNSSSSFYRAYRNIFKMDAVTLNINSLTTYNFSSTGNNTRFKIRVDTLLGNTNAWVERHDYAPHNQNFKSVAPTYVVPNRWVLTYNNATNIRGKIFISADTISNPSLCSIFWRSNEGSGFFEELLTNFNSSTNNFEINFMGSGEYIIARPDQNIPKLVFPDDQTTRVISPSTFKWRKFTDANSYNIQISKNDIFTDIIEDTTGITDTTAKIDNLRNYTQYYWRIRAILGNSTSSWSQTRSFVTELSAPEPISPSDSSNDLEINGSISWSKIENANSYMVEIADNNKFINPVIQSISYNPSYDYKKLKFNKRYFWRIQSKKSEYSGLWSKTMNFLTVLDTARLISPINSATNADPKNSILKWKTVEGANLYSIQLTRDSLFGENVLSYQVANDTVLLLNKLNYQTKYYWKVYASNSNSKGAWSLVGNFKTVFGPPSLILPLDKAKNITVAGELKWERVDNADSYTIQISNDPSFGSLIIGLENFKGTVYPFKDLKYDTKYYWRIKTNIGSNSSIWSEVWDFQTRQEYFIDEPLLSNPKSNQYNLGLTGSFEWEVTPNAISYNLEVSTDSVFENIFIQQNNLTKNSYDFEKLGYNGTYYWRVRAVGIKSISDWSAVRVFYTLLETPQLISPTNSGSSVSRFPSFSWTASIGAENYLFQISKYEGFYIKNEHKLNNPSYVQTDSLTYGTKYYWRVFALNENRVSNWSETFSFTTENINSVVNLIETNQSVVYPNPFNDFIILDKSLLDIESTISIINLEGKSVLELNDLNSNNDFYRINSSGLSNGEYLVNITNGKSRRTIKVIKLGQK